MSKAKQKGTSAESALVKYLQSQGFEDAKRIALAGTHDKGDVESGKLIWEVKNQRSYSIPAWLKETMTEKENASADFGLLAIKPNGIGLGNTGQWWAVLPMAEMIRLLHQAGYGTNQ